jgi:hypothetical protein
MKTTEFVRRSCKEANIDEQVQAIMAWQARTEQESRAERADVGAMTTGSGMARETVDRLKVE